MQPQISDLPIELYKFEIPSEIGIHIGNRRRDCKHTKFADKLKGKVKDWSEDSAKSLALEIASTHVSFAETMQRLNTILLDPKKWIVKNETD